MIEYGDADVMIAGGAEATVIAARRSAASPRRARCRRATTTRRPRAGPGTRTATASCSARAPASLVLEEYEHAKRARRAHLLPSWSASA